VITGRSGAVFYLSHPEVVIDAAVAVPEWRLSPRGRSRVLAIRSAAWLAECRRIVSSGETKALETAALIAGGSGAVIEVREAMHENDRSATGFLPPAEFEQVADAFFAEPERSVRGWERAIDAQARILAEFEAATARHPAGESLLLVGHGGVGTLLYCALAGVPIDRRFDQPSAGSVFAIDPATYRPLFGWTPMEAVAARLAQARTA
jgi:broad specificity phosphatase PhoE